MKKQFMKMQEAADYLGVHKNTLNKWIQEERKISFCRDPVTGYRYFEKQDLDRFFRSIRVSNNACEVCQSSCIEQE